MLKNPLIIRAVDTIKMFDKHKDFMCKELGISSSYYESLKRAIIKEMGYWNKNKTYCGKGESGDKYVPDLWFRFAGYAHDGLGAALVHSSPILLDMFDNDEEALKFINDFFDALLKSISSGNVVKRFFGFIFYKMVDWCYTMDDIQEERDEDRTV